jgi:hypothetical protein
MTLMYSIDNTGPKTGVRCMSLETTWKSPIRSKRVIAAVTQENGFERDENDEVAEEEEGVEAGEG